MHKLITCSNLNAIYSELYFLLLRDFQFYTMRVVLKNLKDPVTSYFNFLFLRHESIVGGDKSDISSGESWQGEAAVVPRDKKRVTNLDVCARLVDVCVRVWADTLVY